MNRHERRAAKARGVTSHDPSRSEAIRLAYEYLAKGAADTATGATLISPDGTVTYLSADDARAFHSGNAK
jgi:hypothetical protein